ncbi:MAG: intradiol ring-cleavage dioxygenase [Blastocatellia bacterium]|nr:intradiol ring-cleavage dioxygenase [Blastocatellia bacterium]
MIDDDKQVGKTLNRRELFGLLGIAGGGLALLGSTTNIFGLRKTPAFQFLPPCVVKPELTEGPYFVDEKINRSDVRFDTKSGAIKEGSLLELEFKVLQVSNNECKVLSEAMVDIWHTDAQGIYSDVQDRQFDTAGQNFLRGYQLTDKEGIAKFTTIYPGWYPGRAVHIHFKIRKDNQEFTSQLFFDESLTDKVHALKEYQKNGGRGRQRNERDGIFRQSNNQLNLNLSESEKGHKAVFEIGMYI